MSAPAKSLASSGDDDNTLAKIGAVSRRQRVQGLVDGYAAQDIEAIMSHFAEEAVYCDILGDGLRGDEYRGKVAIRRSVARQFDITGPHTYVDAKIAIDACFAFASWTLVLGDADDPDAHRFEGVDEFGFDAQGRVVLKKAWLKGQPRLRRALFFSRPAGLLRNIGYAMYSSIR